MDVIYSANDHYARHLAVSMYSLLDHNRQVEKLRVFILSSGIEGDSQQKLRSVAGQFQRELVLIDMGDLRRRFPCQVLYLDCDTVVVDSLEPLWQTPLEGNLLGAVMEPTIYPAVKQSLGLTEREP